MRILVLSFYFAPDLSAGSFRTMAFVRALLQSAAPDLQIDVVTTLPNRYQSFSSEAPEREHQPGLTIRRIALPSHRSDVVGQARAFGVFARGALRELRGRRYDVVYGTSSRLMTAALAALCSRRAGAKLYLDIRDLFADTIGDVFPSAYAWLLKAAFMQLERWTLRSADKVNLVSRGFAGYFAERYPRLALSFVTNGIDPEFIESPSATPEGALEAGPAGARPLRMLYAGNIGEGQGLHHVLPMLATRLAGRAEFKVIGDGGRRGQLTAALAAAGCHNVALLPPVPRSSLLDEYRKADVLFLHLNDHAAFRKVLPSKIFEYAALGKPILAGVAGYAAEFIRQEVDNAAVFAPCDVDAAIRGLGSLRLAGTPRPAFVERYRRERLMQQLAADVRAVAQSTIRDVTRRAGADR
jgi:glycosyltransferase involved in cell wall biosynthesis